MPLLGIEPRAFSFRHFVLLHAAFRFTRETLYHWARRAYPSSIVCTKVLSELEGQRFARTDVKGSQEPTMIPLRIELSFQVSETCVITAYTMGPKSSFSLFRSRGLLVSRTTYEPGALTGWAKKLREGYSLSNPENVPLVTVGTDFTRNNRSPISLLHVDRPRPQSRPTIRSHRPH